MRRLEETIEINAAPQAVWAVLADFGGVAKWAPGIRWSALAGQKEAGIGTRRSMRHFWGFRFDETVTEWTDGFGYAFELTQTPYPMRNVRETWAIEGFDTHTLVTTTVSYNLRLNFIGAWLDQTLVRFLVAREMRAGIRALKLYSEQNASKYTALAPLAASKLETESD